MKSVEVLLKEYCSKLKDDDLYYLYSRFTQFLTGDRADISNYLSQSKDLDRWLASAESSNDFFDMLDKVGEFVVKEFESRNK